MMGEQYGHWNIWCGGECPVSPDTIVQVRTRAETQRQAEIDAPMPASAHRWSQGIPAHDVIAWRHVKAQHYQETADLIRSEAKAIAMDHHDWSARTFKTLPRNQKIDYAMISVWGGMVVAGIAFWVAFFNALAWLI